jgi:hypothetical protein
MIVAWKTILRDLTGKELTAENQESLTLEKLAINALSQMTESDGVLSGAEKYSLGELAFKIYTEPDSEFSEEEISKIKLRVGFLYTPIAVYQVYKLLS